MTSIPTLEFEHLISLLLSYIFIHVFVAIVVSLMGKRLAIISLKTHYLVGLVAYYSSFL